MIGDAIDDIDERGRVVSGDTLLILLNAHTNPPEARLVGGTKYPLQARTVVLFRLEKHRPYRRASDHEARGRMALQLTR